MIVKLEYRDVYGRRTPWWRAFNTPDHPTEVRLDPGDPFATHILVIPPSDMELELKSTSFDPPFNRPPAWTQHFHENHGDRLIEYAIPPPPVQSTFKLSYRVNPEEEEARVFWWFLVGSYLVSVLLMSLIVVAKSYTAFSSGWAPALMSHLTLLGGGLLAVIVGFLGLVTNPTTHRTKLWMLIPLVLAGIVLSFGLVAGS